MLNLEQKQRLFIQLHSAIYEDKDDAIIKLLKDVDPEDQVWVLTARCDRFPGTLPFLACVLSSDKTFLALVHNLPHSHYVKVFKEIEDGNTPLTEALSWGRTSRIKTLLAQVNDKTFVALLNTENWRGFSLKLLLSEKESEAANENLLADIQKMRAKQFSPTAAMLNFGLHAIKSESLEEKHSDPSATPYNSPI